MGLLTRSSRRQLSTLINRATRKIAGKLLEPLEDRKLYTAVPTLNISGPGVVSEGSTYTLALSATGSNFTPIDHWTINWGDSQTTTFAGNPSTATHVYADGPSTATITGTATLTDNTVVTANLGGASTDNGTLDPSFNGTGKVTVDPGGTSSIGKSVAVQSDGKLVEVGTTDGVAHIIRLNPDGSLDTSFAGTGKIVSNFGVNFVASAVSMQTVAGQEKILVAGNGNTSLSHSNLIRLNLDGSLDTTFGVGGIASFSFPGFFEKSDGIRSIAVMSDGRIVTAGAVISTSNTSDVAIARFTPNGSLDTTFNGTGQVTTDLGSSADTALNVLLNSDNSITVLAQGNHLVRYTAAGALDPTFGVGGVANIPATNQFVGEGFAIDASGNIYVSGNTFGVKPGGSENAAIARFTPNGSLDTSFQTGGFESFFLDLSNDEATNVAFQSDGKIILAGFTTNFLIGAGPGQNFFVMRLLTDGTQDNTFGPPTADRFGNVGTVRLDFLGGNDTPGALGFTNDGRLIVAGSAQNPAGTTSVVAIAQFGSAGTTASPVSVIINNANPNVSIVGLPASSNEGTALNLSANVSDPSPVDTAAGFTYSWVVSKDSSFYASATTPTFTLNPDDNGLYQVTVFVHDKDGGAASDTQDITINNVAPTVNTIGAPTTSPESTTITASASATDPSPVDTAAGFTYAWSVSKDSSPFAAGTGANASFTPDDNGTYVLTITATDKDNGVGSSISTITVTNVAPGTSFTSAPMTGTEGAEISFTGSATDVSPVDTAAGLTYSWTVSKDGNAFAAGTGSTIDFTPDDNGTYVVTLTATDKDNGAGSAMTTINVANTAPVVTLPNAPTAGNEGDTISYSGASITDASAADTAAGFTTTWTVTKNGGAFAAGTGTNITFTPDDNGDYQLTVSATDKDNATTSASADITIANVAPSFAGSGASSFSPEGTTITSTAAATDPSTVDTSDGLTYSWSVSKDSAPFASGSGVTAVFTPDDNGIYVLTQSATDKDGATGTTTSTIHVTNVAPSVSLPGAPTAGNEGSAISYSGASATDPSTVDTAQGFTYSWSVTKNSMPFASGAGVNATFTPDDNGLYSLTVTATDKDGDSGSASSDITVANVAPTVSLSNVPTTGNEGTAISFTAGSSISDPSTADTAAGFTTVWSVTKNNSPFASGSGTNVSFTPDDNGVYKLTLTATDKDGDSGSDSSIINVSNVAPTVSLSNVPATGNEGSTISFAISSSVTDPSTADTAAGFTTAWTVKKNGSPFASGSGTNVSFTPNDNGVYQLTLTATDKDGGSGSASSIINVLNVAPTVSLTNVPTTGAEGTAISFTAGSSISDPSTVDTAAGFTISWSATKNGSPYASGSGTSINFTPNDNGTYVLTLSATDKDGGTGSASRTINVANVAPTITSDTITPTTAVRNQTINYASTFTDPGTLDNPTATWNFGDGNTASGATASHVYTATGTYTVTLTVTDKDGGATTQTKQVTILAVTIETDPADPTKTALYIGGTNANDTITVNPGGGSSNGAQVILNGVNLGVFNITGHIVVFGGAGDDNIQIAGGLNYPTELFGQAGNDKIKGDNATNIIVGGDGNDVLVGGNNRDLLIGGNGADQITGGSNDDILVASATSFDANSAALESIMKEWTRTDACFADRVIHLLYGGGLNGSNTINTDTVFADANTDTLTGSSGDDVFVFNTNDDITDFNLKQDAGAVDLSWIIVPF